MEYTKEQIKAAYALNLCTVSVSQIIEYEDLQIMEQEYEAILNNLNLEQIPKDEALLKILKQILDTITYFRIEDGDKQFLDKEYQQKMKNAIWSAVPNIGMIVASGDPVAMAVSLASQIGIGYMNYRKAKAEATQQLEKDLWKLERTAIEQFNGLRRELFDTAWRLSAAHNFPDQLRLTERQIKQYNAILMDNDLLRKYQRLTVIQGAFLAYPPFWYHYGNTANAIAQSTLNLSEETRNYYRLQAKNHFTQYRTSNDHGLLREDPISASCALELMDLLDPVADHALIMELAQEAISYSGRSNDVLQLTAMAYLRLNEPEHAADVLHQLVNEQYNTVLNAQLLSSIYVSNYIKTMSADSKSRYEILSCQVGTHYLYPMPLHAGANLAEIEAEFLKTQKEILWAKYRQVIHSFVNKYAIKFGKLIPVTDRSKDYMDSYFFSNDEALQIRKYDIAKVFNNRRKKDLFCEALREADIPYGILDLLNELFDACTMLALMTDQLRQELFSLIRDAITQQKDLLNDFQEKLEAGQVDMLDIDKLLQLSLKTFTGQFFERLGKEAYIYVDSLHEMQGFAAAEENLTAFCVAEGLPEPYFEQQSILDVQQLLPCPKAYRQTSFSLLVQLQPSCDRHPAQNMVAIIESFEDSILIDDQSVSLYLSRTPELAQYFRRHRLTDNALLSNALAILDDLTQKGDYDLIFTSYGIVPVKSGSTRSVVKYSQVKWTCTKKQEYLEIDGKYEIAGVDTRALYEMCMHLQKLEQNTPEQESLFKLPEGFNLFKKND